MKKPILFAVSALLMLASCEKKSVVPSFENSETEGLVPVKVQINPTRTKATTDNPAEDKINNLQVFLYRIDTDDNQTLESYYSFLPEANGGTIYIDPAKDAKEYRIAAYANQASLTQANYTQDWALFQNESENNFQMFGQSIKSKDVILDEKTVSVSLIRQSSKVTVRNISINWTNSANNFKVFKLKGMFLMDVEGVFKNIHEIALDDRYSLWQNKNGHNSSSHDALLYDSIDEVVVDKDTPYQTDHIFYGYMSALGTYNQSSEWQPGGTRLVIEADFDGQTCYYAVKINGINNNTPLDEIRNKHFIFENITITKPGSDQPYGSLTDETAITVSVSVAEWGEISNGNVTIE